ncbi:FAD-binding oxidoreductase [Sphingomonas solaris]|uniref:D-lactate dehydrogenase (cytochrome) n=1 Tax=Alterirhizorhabdus solaris TaxID=2529389 RepID=A0A558RAW2_9SPHN|nr:FAD-binding oxidoreductase [Sphingomonas solaris]TVV76539.1 FAD-binding oxidoreductase [Sphingomonas solaris]
MQQEAYAPTLDTPDLTAVFARIVGADHARDDEAIRALHSEDVWQASPATVALVVSPGSTDEVVAVAKAAHAAGYAIAPRGAGMSYTAGYVPAHHRTISLDMSRMNRILRLSREDMTITVEAGATWTAVHVALAAQGLRLPFWGPMSGLSSTIGGGVSQLNAMFGAGHYGTSSESVVALKVVTADGAIVRTGARGPDGDTPHYRHFGPDLTGLFCGDCGTLGIKAEVTLRLITAPAFEDTASFSFQSGEALLQAMAEIARSGVAAETCAFDPGLTVVRMKRASLAGDIKTLGKVVAKEKSFGKGLLAAAKIAMGGRNFIAPTDYPFHFACEGRSRAAVEADMAEARRICLSFGGAEIENTIAKVIRAMPFPALNSMLGPTGEAWVPCHGVVSLSTAPAIFAEVQAVFARRRAEMEAAEIHTGFLFTTMATNAIVIEPVFFWPQGWRKIHESAVEPSHLARLTQRPLHPEATALVTALRKELIAIFARYGAGHFQIGRTYPYRESRDAVSQALLDAVKHVTDPDGLLNPGVLGFPDAGGKA